MDVVDSMTRSRMMSGIRSRNTKPELLIRSGLHRRGFRFRVNDGRVFGHPDLVLPKYRAVVFVHGCFWHGHEGCRYFRLPATRPDFWKAKIEANRKRDAQVLEKLQEAGWRVCVVWECRLRTRAQWDTLDQVLDSIAVWLCTGGEWLEIRGSD